MCCIKKYPVYITYLYKYFAKITDLIGNEENKVTL